MKKTVLVIAVALMAVAMMATPVLAAPAEKVPIVFYPSGVSDKGGTINTTPSGIIHVNNAERTATANLKIGSVWYVGSIHVDLDYIIDPIKGSTTQHYHKITMTFSVAKNPSLSQEGTFEGVLKWTVEFANPTGLAAHAVLQGAGAFEGQTLWISNMHNPGPLTGWLLVH